jgi:RimJ/RimL family protein N-acetyltransferase
MAHPWPLFDLRVRYLDVELRLPNDTELRELLRIAKDGIHPPGQCPFLTPWSEVPSPAFERNFFQHHWQLRGGWTPENWTLNFGVWVDGRLVGSQSLRGDAFAVRRTVETGSWLGQEFQGGGVGTRMRQAALGFAFDHLGAQFAQSGYLPFNVASNRVSLKLGYRPDGTEVHDQAGKQVIEHRMRLERERWDGSRPDGIEVTGLDECRDMFGI